MAYVEKKTIGGNIYYYLTETRRVGNKWKKTRKYLGGTISQNLNFLYPRKTKILFTWGPASSKPAVFKSLASIANGVRINTAHGTVQDHAKAIDSIRKNSVLPIVLDIKGPELRIILEKPIQLYSGSEFEICFSGKNRFSYDFSAEAKKGDRIIFDDGKLEAKITSISTSGVRMRAKNSHLLKTEKTAHIPARKINIPPLSRKDLEEIKLANRKKVEFLALSFTRSAFDIINLRKKLDDGISIIAKIENKDGIRNIDEIIREADGVMVARGDLALDIGQEKIPLAQKEIIRKCNDAGKLSITATQVLETMVDNLYPTRAEVSDIANAILDGSDCIMLSGETAIGKYPIKAAETIASVASEVESSVACKVVLSTYQSISDAISKSIYTISNIMPLDAIVSITRSGYTARMISRFRMKNRIIATTPYENVKKQLLLYFGIEPVYIPEIPQTRIIPTVASLLYSKKMLKKEDSVLFTAGVRTREKHASNLIEIHKIKELLGL